MTVGMGETDEVAVSDESADEIGFLTISVIISGLTIMMAVVGWKLWMLRILLMDGKRTVSTTTVMKT